MHELPVHPDCHRDAGTRLSIVQLDQVSDNVVDFRFLGPAGWVHLEDIKELIFLFLANFSRSHGSASGSNLNGRLNSMSERRAKKEKTIVIWDLCQTHRLVRT